MSPACDLLLVGSAAAWATGCLPPWRETYDDIDFVGSPDMMNVVAHHFGVTEVRQSPATGRYWMFGASRFIEFATPDYGANQLLLDLPDHIAVKFDGLECHAISPTTQAMIKEVWSQRDYKRQVHLRDLHFFRQLAAPTMDHLILRDAMRGELVTRS